MTATGDLSLARCSRGVALARQLVAALSLLSGPMAFGQGPVPVQGEFQVNSYTTDGQFRPAVASLADGGFVALWQSFGSSGSDQSGTSVQGQRFAADATLLGAQFQVNTYTPNGQSNPSVAALADGGFVALWTSYGSSGSDTPRLGILGQRYGADGTALGGEFQVNSFTSRDQKLPSVAALADGGFVAVWSGFSSGSDTSDSSIQGRRYRPDGLPLGEQFQVNTYTANRQGPTSVAAFADGGFVAVWQSWTPGGNAGLSIQGQRYAADGTALGPEFRVNSTLAEDQRQPSVAVLDDDSFVVVWYRADSTDSIQGRRYAADGTALGGQFQVNSNTASGLWKPSVAGLAGGGFAVVWNGQRPLYPPDGVKSSIQGRRYAADSRAVAGQFKVSSYPGLHLGPVVSALADGFVTLWASSGSSGSDMSNWSVQGQLYAPPRFALVGLGGECLDVQGGETSAGTPVNLERCNGSANQRWQLDLAAVPQRVVAIGGRCLLPGPVDADGNIRVVLGDCGAEQDASVPGDDLWQLVSTGHADPSFLIHAETGRCLGVGGSDGDRTPARLLPCHGGADQTWRPAAEVCTRDSLGLCLGQERFRVDLAWSSFDDTTGSGKAVPEGSDESGLLWFFEANNWEALVKVLDGCAINDRFWVFAAAATTVEYTLTVTDTALGTIRDYFNPLGNAADAITDTDAFATCSAASGSVVPPVEAALRRPLSGGTLRRPSGETTPVVSATGVELKGDCAPSATRMCFFGGRFEVEVAWRDHAGNVGSGQVVGSRSRDSGLFWFFNAANWEMLVKVLDACHLEDPHFLILAAATTDVEYTLRVTDTETGDFREIFNPLGTAAAAVVDTFETCP